jgi:hypothetical protein
MTLSITLLVIMLTAVMLDIKCRIFIVRLDVVNLSVVMLTVVAPIGEIVLPLKKQKPFMLPLQILTQKYKDKKIKLF